MLWYLYNLFSNVSKDSEMIKEGEIYLCVKPIGGWTLGKLYTSIQDNYLPLDSGIEDVVEQYKCFKKCFKKVTKEELDFVKLYNK